MLPEPEEPALSDQFGDENADDEYGGGKISVNPFTLLNKTTWSVDQVVVRDVLKPEVSFDILQTSLETNKIVFLISGDFGMAWATEYAKKTPLYTDFNILFNDPNNLYYSGWQFAPLFMSSNGFKGVNETSYSYEALFHKDGYSDSEKIEITEHFDDTPLVAKKIRVTNDFASVKAYDAFYTSELYLSRVDHFSILDQTDWQIKSIDVIGLVKDDNGKYINGNPKNYQVTKRDNVKKITLRTSFENNVGVLNFITDDKNKIASEPLIATFKDLTI